MGEEGDEGGAEGGKEGGVRGGADDYAAVFWMRCQLGVGSERRRRRGGVGGRLGGWGWGWEKGGGGFTGQSL